MSNTVPRRSILLVAAAAVFANQPKVGLAQPKRRVYRVGVLDLRMDTPMWKEFVAELSRRGYTVGTNIVFENRLSLGLASDLDRVVGELVKANVDVIFTYGGPSALAAKKATLTIPIVFVASPDPVGQGIVPDLSHPGANLTGSSLQAWNTNVREIQLLAEVSGRLTSLAILNPGGSPPESAKAPLINVARALGCRIQFINYESVRELEPLVERLAREGVDGVGVADAPSSDVYRRLAALLIKLRLPSIGEPSDGYLLGYEYASLPLVRVAARQLDQILKGTKPGDLPVELASTFELAINLRTAKELGLSIPSSVLLQATRLIQ